MTDQIQGKKRSKLMAMDPDSYLTPEMREKLRRNELYFVDLVRQRKRAKELVEELECLLLTLDLG